MHTINQDGKDWVLPKRREPVDSATPIMVADALYDGKPRADLSEEELIQGSKCLLAMIRSTRVMRILATRYSVC